MGRGNVRSLRGLGPEEVLLHVLELVKQGHITEVVVAGCGPVKGDEEATGYTTGWTRCAPHVYRGLAQYLVASMGDPDQVG